MSQDNQQWTWIVHCPNCLTTKSLGREDFDGAAKMVFRCSACGEAGYIVDVECPGECRDRPYAGNGPEVL